MIFNLVKKDLILAKKYLLFMLVFAAGAPVYLETQTHSISGGLLGFIIAVLFALYMLFNTVSMSEDKYKGAALLSATPYTRKALVKAKYLFILIIFVSCYIIYTLTASLLPMYVTTLSLFALSISFLIVAGYFGIIVPLQYRFGYEKVRYISFFSIFITPFIFPGILKWYQANDIHFQITLPFPQLIQDLLPALLAVVMGLISMAVSVRIYSKKDL